MCPLLRNGGGKDTGRAAAIVVNLSARVGSIGDNRLGGWHSYRSSKAALNQCEHIFVHFVLWLFIYSFSIIMCMFFFPKRSRCYYIC